MEYKIVSRFIVLCVASNSHLFVHKPSPWSLNPDDLSTAYSVVSSATMQTTNLILGLGSRQPDDNHTTKPILMFDPRTNALVTSARPGYLLFYDVVSCWSNEK